MNRSYFRHFATLLLFAGLFVQRAMPASAQEPAKSTKKESSIGLPVRIDEIVLPGTELEAKPIDDPKSKLMLRVVSSFPHGTARRYNLEYYGLEPGTYDLRDYLRRKDASSIADLPAIPVTIVSVLPAGQILPSKLEAVSPPWLGGYRILLLIGAVFWVVVLLAILLVGRRRKVVQTAVQEHELTFAERLQPLVESAVAGHLTLEQQAKLERLLLGYWSERLGLRDVDPAEAIYRLRAHPHAGELLRQVEAWLHQPGGERETDVVRMLAPYRGAASPMEAAIVAEEVRA